MKTSPPRSAARPFGSSRPSLPAPPHQVNACSIEVPLFWGYVRRRGSTIVRFAGGRRVISLPYLLDSRSSPGGKEGACLICWSQGLQMRTSGYISQPSVSDKAGSGTTDLTHGTIVLGSALVQVFFPDD